MTKNKITVQGIEVRLQQTDQSDFICLTDIAKTASQPTDYTIRNWLRNRGTIEFLGVWESLHNPQFNPAGFDGIRLKTGLNNFSPSASDWIAQTAAIGVVSSPGRYGGTFAHFDIAIHFCNWLSAEFYAYFIQQFRQMKEANAARLQEPWDLRRELAKGNYFIHTDAVRQNIVPVMDWNTRREGLYFATEADLLNLVVFGTTAKQWKLANPDNPGNLRDHATVEELHILANMESINAALIEQRFTKEERILILTRRVERESEVLQQTKAMKEVKKLKSGG